MLARLRSSSLSLAAVALGLLIGAVLVAIQGKNPWTAASAIYHGSMDGTQPIGRTLDKASPLICTGLAVMVALKAGLFNIGAQGQVVTGAIVSGYVGYAVKVPAPFAVVIAIVFGSLAATLPALLAGVLKATRGVHEVISTIMLNTVVFGLAEWLSGPRGPWKKPRAGFPRTPDIRTQANIPHVHHLPISFLIAVAAVIVVWVLLGRTTIGFRLATVGANRHAAHYAGISVASTVILAMAISGGLAGLAGSIQSLGVVGYYTNGSATGLGFDGITIALLARIKPTAAIPAAVFIGAMRASNTALQSEAKIAPEIIDVVVAVILLLVAAPVLVRAILRLKGDAGGELRLTSGWGA